MFFLKAQLELFGLKAPMFSWVVSAVLIAYAVYVYGRHLRVSRNRHRLLTIAEKRLQPLVTAGMARPDQGITGQGYRAVAAVFDDLPPLRPYWQAVASAVIVREDENGEERMWRSDDLRIEGADIIDNQSYRTAPTVISGVGLLATFLAILVALLDVKLAQNRVQGLDLLVQGLSGKFLSSVVAVGCATLLVSAERGVYRPVARAVQSLKSVLEGVLPRLTGAQIMADLRKEAAGQSKMMKALGAELASDLKRGLNEAIAPTMERMAFAVTDLSRTVRELETEKRDATDDRLAPLFRDFAQSLDASFEKMAGQLNDSGAAGTRRELSRISDSLSTTVTLLQEVNGQLVTNQTAFNDLINLARNTTADEVASRQGQIEQLTGVVGELMVKLQEKTEESTGSMQRAIAAITCDMSSKVLDLSAQMAGVIEKASEKSNSTTRKLMDHAGSLSARSAEQLAQLFERHSAELTKVEDLRTLLDTTIKAFVGSIGKYGEVTDGLRKIAGQVNAGVASLSQITKSIKECQEAAARVSVSVSGQIESMKGFGESQRQVWDRVEASMLEYEKVFARVEGHAMELLSHIARHLGGYSDTTQKHFAELTSVADNFISRATGRLSASIDDLSEQLDDLHGALADMGRVSHLAG